MPTWNSLPTEILHDIFTRLDQKDDAQCSLTCRAWKSAAQCALFNKLPSMTENQFYILAMTLMACKKDESPANFVKSICCEKFSDNFEWALLDLLFPHLEDIHVYTDKQRFCDKVFELLKGGMLLSLKSLPFGEWKNSNLDLILNRKEYLTKLGLFLLRPDSNAGQIFKQLDHFPKLKSISISWNYNNKTTVYLEDLLSVQNATLERIDVGRGGNDQVNLKSANVDISSVQPYLSVKDLNIHNSGPSLNGEEMYIYLMQKFPNLEYLNMRSSVRTLFEQGNYTSPTLASLSQFFIYLFNIKLSYVSAIITNQHTTKAIVNLYNYILNHNPCGVENVDLELTIAFATVIPEFHSNNYTAYIEALVDSRGRKKRCKLNVFYKITTKTINIPHLDLFQQIGDVDLKYLTIGEANYWKVEQGRQIGSLDVIFNNFKKLEKLKLYLLQDVYFTENTLSLEKRLPSTLKILKFTLINLTKDICQKISIISRNLETMIIKQCVFIKDYAYEETARIVPIVMPFTRLRELFLSIKLAQFSKMFIRLKTDSEKPRYCKLIKIKQGHSIFYTEFDSVKDVYTDDDYKMCFHDSECIVYDIYCKSVAKLTVEIGYMMLSDKKKATKVYLGENNNDQI